MVIGARRGACIIPDPDTEVMQHIVIPGAPKGRTDPQAVAFGAHARLVQRKGSRSYEAFVAMVVHEAIGSEPIIDYPVRLDILAVFPRPGRLNHRREPDGLILHAQKPDRDNVEKAIQDGMKSCWRDDCLVSIGTTVKAYAERGGKPRVEVWLSPTLRVDFHGHGVDMPAAPRPKRASKLGRAPLSMCGTCSCHEVRHEV